IDMGQPMANGRAVVDDGSNKEPLELTGYSIIEATNMDEAVELVDGHPFLSDKTGKFSVEVFELMPVPGM
ncbi:MAG TPA: YciI family protein, partial [Patescibacteria group bacterium]|nr:YciI family protein [Patescibacteria group bacterium]